MLHCKMSEAMCHNLERKDGPYINYIHDFTGVIRISRRLLISGLYGSYVHVPADLEMKKLKKKGRMSL